MVWPGVVDTPAVGSNMIPAQLDGPLGKLRARVLALACLRGLGIAVTVFLIGCVITGWTDLIVAMPSFVRLIFFVACVAVATAALVWVVVLMNKRATSRRLAAELDKVGNTGGQIQAGVELAEASGTDSALTADLKRRAIVLSSEIGRASCRERVSKQV